MSNDPWLQRWLPLIRERASGLAVLELGCGDGEDTATLAAAGHHIIAIDLSARAIAEAQVKVPAAEYHCQDMRAPFPAQATGLGVVVASLSLHYFAWPETIGLVENIRDALRTGGILLCRLNSTNDHHYGASGHPRIADNYYSVDGEPKRFFDRESVHELFAKGWSMLAIEEMVIHRYAQPKTVWEVVLERGSSLLDRTPSGRHSEFLQVLDQFACMQRLACEMVIQQHAHQLLALLCCLCSAQE